MSKRPDGALEHDIMTVLWNARRPLQPGEIKERLAIDLAYTSVATVLGRLQAKGLVTRSESGRAFAYEAALAESERHIKDLAEFAASARQDYHAPQNPNLPAREDVAARFEAARRVNVEIRGAVAPALSAPQP